MNKITIVDGKNDGKFEAGDIIMFNEDEVGMIANVESNFYCVICLCTGNRWNDPIQYNLKNNQGLSRKQVSDMCNDVNFKRINSVTIETKE